MLANTLVADLEHAIDIRKKKNIVKQKMGAVIMLAQNRAQDLIRDVLVRIVSTSTDKASTVSEHWLTGFPFQYVYCLCISLTRRRLKSSNKHYHVFTFFILNLKLLTTINVVFSLTICQEKGERSATDRIFSP